MNLNIWKLKYKFMKTFDVYKIKSDITGIHTCSISIKAQKS